jgi:hypothetical protein
LQVIITGRLVDEHRLLGRIFCAHIRHTCALKKEVVNSSEMLDLWIRSPRCHGPQNFWLNTFLCQFFKFQFADQKHDPADFVTYAFEGPDNLLVRTAISLCFFNLI